MYRIAICEDENVLAAQNEQMTQEILDGRGLVRGTDYDIDTYATPDALHTRLVADDTS